jgi:tetratricopeptide (TPR) repeat protein
MNTTPVSGRAGQRIVRRLAAAEGYLELQMPEYALFELNAIGDCGPFVAIAELLRGEAFKAQSRFEEAIHPLHRAAEMFPAPYCKRAWLALSECYRERGQEELALAATQAAMVCNQVAGLSPGNLHVKPIFLVESKTGRRTTPPAASDQTDGT